MPSAPERQQVLTRGVEPPRVSPYGPEPYASAIPPRELFVGERLLRCAPRRAGARAKPILLLLILIMLLILWAAPLLDRIMIKIMSMSRNRLAGAGRGVAYERRFFRARSSSWFAWRALPSERSRSA